MRDRAGSAEQLLFVRTRVGRIQEHYRGIQEGFQWQVPQDTDIHGGRWRQGIRRGYIEVPK